jgi:hypothetical protein
MANRNALFLHEEIMLLALSDKKGTTEFEGHFRYALGGALLAELLLRKRVRVDDTKKRKLVEVASAQQVGDPLIDECLERVVRAKKRASLKTWVSRFSGIKRLKHRVAERLCQRGVLRADEDKVLLIFSRKIYPEVNPEPERQLIERLREAIFTDKREIDSYTVVLVSLAKNTDLLKMAFEKKELKRRKARIEQVINGDLTGKATKEVIEAIQAAIFVACIVPAIVSN